MMLLVKKPERWSFDHMHRTTQQMHHCIIQLYPWKLILMLGQIEVPLLSAR